MTLRPGDVVLTWTAFHQTTGGKQRPTIVLLDTGDNDFVGVPVTSQFRTSVFDIPLLGWRNAGLHVPSTIRVHKLGVRSKLAVIRLLGSLTENDRESLREAVRRAFSML